MVRLALAGLIALSQSACPRPADVSASPAATVVLPSPASAPPVTTGTPSADPPLPSDAQSRALAALEALRAKNTAALAALVDPDDGVRFSPYSYVDGSDIRIAAGKLETALRDKRVRRWGAYDGSGDPIDLTFAEYYERFVFDVDFTKGTRPPQNFTENTTDNAQEVYGPDARIVELYLEPHDSSIDGLDWRMLRLVMKRRRGVYYVVGIVHTEWTT
jgi:hypothetical protein